MVEVRVEVGNSCDLLLNSCLIWGSRADHADKIFGASVAKTWVDATDAVVLVLAHILHVGCLLIELSIVEEHISIEGAFLVVLGPLRDRLIDVEAEALTIAHGIDELLANTLSDALVSLVSNGLLDDLWSELEALTFVVHESADAALLVPDEEVLACLVCIRDNQLEPLQGLLGPVGDGVVAFDHFVSESVLITSFIQQKAVFCYVLDGSPRYENLDKNKTNCLNLEINQD